MAFGLEKFKTSPLGIKVGELLNNPTTVLGFITLSRHKMPAVQDIGKPIMALGLPVTDADKKHIGRWVREVMETKGWTTSPTSKGRVTAGNLFSTGSIYFPKNE